jgi:hypothetical protein
MKGRTSVALLGLALAASWVYALSAQAPASVTDGPKYAAGTNNLIRPDNYREWIFLGSSLGLDYRAPTPGQPPGFGNVFVNPSSYRSFMQTGKWPDKTIFVLEFRAPGKETIADREGRFQTSLNGIEAEVKDSRFPDGWGFYGGFNGNTPSTPLTGDVVQRCIDCHTKNTAVERTFVQFYPTLFEVAKKMGTVKATFGEP